MNWHVLGWRRMSLLDAHLYARHWTGQSPTTILLPFQKLFDSKQQSPNSRDSKRRQCVQILCASIRCSNTARILNIYGCHEEEVGSNHVSVGGVEDLYGCVDGGILICSPELLRYASNGSDANLLETRPTVIAADSIVRFCAQPQNPFYFDVSFLRRRQNKRFPATCTG